MRPTWLLLVLIVTGLSAGCMSSQRKPFASNPLLLYYKPTLSDSSTILAEQAARREPAKPPMPTFARDNAPTAPAMLRRPDPEDITPVKSEQPANDRPIIRQSSASSQPELKIEVAPAPLETKPTIAQTTELIVRTQKVEVTELPNVPITMTTFEPAPVARKRVPGSYGHDPDYRWLQGIVQRHSRGGCFIRFCDPSVENEYGGKFQVENEVALAPYRDGEIVGVSGELVPGETSRYRVRDVWRIN